MKATIEIPDDLLREIKARAAREGRELKESLADVIRQGLGNPPTVKKGYGVVGKKSPSPFPFFEGTPDAPITRMTSREIIEMEHNLLLSEELQRAGVSL